MKKILCVLFTFTFETAKWITLYLRYRQTSYAAKLTKITIRACNTNQCWLALGDLYQLNGLDRDHQEDATSVCKS